MQISDGGKYVPSPPPVQANRLEGLNEPRPQGAKAIASGMGTGQSSKTWTAMRKRK